MTTLCLLYKHKDFFLNDFFDICIQECVLSDWKKSAYAVRKAGSSRHEGGPIMGPP